jgi:hypothetical protein
MRYVGVSSRGIRLPVITRGADLVEIISTELIKASQSSRDSFPFRDGDIVGVTESLLARAQGNCVTLEDIAEDVRLRLPPGDVALIFPILSRNRFGRLLTGIVRGVQGKIHILLSYPADEVGNLLMDPHDFFLKSEQIPGDLFGEKEYDEIFGRYLHPFTGVDYVAYYKEMAPEKIEIHFANNPLSALNFSKTVIVASIHARFLHREILERAGARVFSLDQFCSAPGREGAGFNEEYGLLGSNYTSEREVKLFPRESRKFARELSDELGRRTGKRIEVLVYGDGAFKDPVGGIWELADPVVSPGYTDGLEGLPKEIKFKYIADNSGEQSPEEAVREAIRNKEKMDRFAHSTLGTTPRRLTDLLGSLCDLTSGSGDKGTPVIHISGYFDSYLDE